ncbi:NlpC/P60 family protein [Streptomyces sp. NBC_00320]|uniref:NlpC/P60 family protein n=1 Tax=Streptomyces sp. NBC_00320 TaxID=2975711 RepID=UPI00224CFECD|nr:NlpC/P60 family protein [Streptomyces sp. NBC_00320]MCX5145419.1 NlpC/P60 family protein [Streptomyces sp. NBC_00320]
MSRRLLRAACIAAVVVTAGPFPATHAKPAPDSPSARATARQSPGAADAVTRHTARGANADPRQNPGATDAGDSPARQGPGGAARQNPGFRGRTAPQGLGAADAITPQAADPADAVARQGAGATPRQSPGAGGTTVRRAPGAGGTTGPRATDAGDSPPRQGPGSAARRSLGSADAGDRASAGSADTPAPQTTGGADATAPRAGSSADADTPASPGAADATAPRATGSADAGDPASPRAAGAAGSAAGLGAAGVGGLLAQLRGLYRQAEEAAEAYNATEVALKAAQDEELRLSAALGKARTALGAEKAAAGRMAREQYQGARGFSPYARMLLTGDPQAAQDQRRLTAREGARRAGVLARLTRGEHRADVLATAARKSLDARQSLTAQRKQHKQQVDLKLKQVERMLASLSPEQLTRLGTREAADTATAQRNLLDSGRLATTPRTPTAAGGAALTYATEQIGKPYVWGAEGPGSFDCSGLTSQAWAHAGRSIPRTSQEQWAQLPKVPLDELRPGDLVVYFPTATHVALYVGDGKVIQAPRPGAKVKVSPIAANPLLGAVRPDPDGAPLAEFTAPPVPEASGGDDSGYSADAAPADATDATSAT